MNEAGETTFWQWLLGLDRINPGDADAVLGWRYSLPPWGWGKCWSSTRVRGRMVPVSQPALDGP